MFAVETVEKQWLKQSTYFFALVRESKIATFPLCLGCTAVLDNSSQIPLYPFTAQGSCWPRKRAVTCSWCGSTLLLKVNCSLHNVQGQLQHYFRIVQLEMMLLVALSWWCQRLWAIDDLQATIKNKIFVNKWSFYSLFSCFKSLMIAKNDPVDQLAYICIKEIRKVFFVRQIWKKLKFWNWQQFQSFTYT